MVINLHEPISAPDPRVERHDAILSFLAKDYSSLLAPGFWERLWNERHRLTNGQFLLLLKSKERFLRGDYRSALILLAECIDTPEGMERRTGNIVGRMALRMELLCGLLPSLDSAFAPGYAENRLVAPTVMKMYPPPSYKAAVIKRLNDPHQTDTGLKF